MNVPNLLTLMRIFFVPLLIAALVQENRMVVASGVQIESGFLALGIFLAAAATDLLDGYLARKWGQITTVGTLLDPIADKLLISAALVSLVQVRVLPGWMAILIISREFAVSGLRSIAAAEGYTIRASELGKTKMVLQVIAVSLLMLGMHFPEIHTAGMWAMWAVVVFALASAVDYFRKFWRKVDDRIKRRRRRELLSVKRSRLHASLAGKRAAN